MHTKETGKLQDLDTSFVYEGLVSGSMISEDLLHFDKIAICS